MSSASTAAASAFAGDSPAAERSDLEWQAQVLPGVSRTFALTIPALPRPLCQPVTTAYLLCRIADTIEDEATLSVEDKVAFGREFVSVVEGRAPAEDFALRLAGSLSDATLPAERDLARDTARVVRVLRSFPERQRAALSRCVRIMCAGMERFQLRASLAGLADLRELDSYCYHVAGVVGETLTELFCGWSPEIAARHDELAELSVSFGQGLQMTNILKDVWDDRERGACWLPRDVFAAHGFDLARLDPAQRSPEFEAGLAELIAVAHGHLRHALRYTLLIPRGELGIRRFALWALSMAVLTLRKINRHRDFSESRAVKIRRSSVRATILTTEVAGRRDALSRAVFRLSSIGLPSSAVRPAGAPA